MLQATHGEGYTFDVSTHGCRIESDSVVGIGKFVSLQLDLESAKGYRARIIIEAARVRWVKQHTFVVEFVKVTSQNQELLLEYVHELENKWVG